MNRQRRAEIAVYMAEHPAYGLLSHFCGPSEDYVWRRITAQRLKLSDKKKLIARCKKDGWRIVRVNVTQSEQEYGRKS